MPEIQPPTASRTAAPSWFPYAAIFAVALILRLMLLDQGLAYNEILALAQFVHQPWAHIVGLHAPAYSPHNSILYSLLAKLTMAVGGDTAAMARLPAALAGSAVGIALVWPLRRAWPRTALLIALFVALHPWLIVFSAEASGYALALLLCAVATNLLFAAKPRPTWQYVLTMTAAIYTLPLALAVLLAHGLTLVALGRKLRPWLLGALATFAVSAILYAPFIPGMIDYARQPHAAPPLLGSLAEIGGLVVRGYALPGNTLAAALSILLLIAAVRIGWRLESSLRPHIGSFLFAAVLTVILAMLFPAAGQSRFFCWVIPPFALGAAMALSMIAALLTRPLGSRPRLVQGAFIVLMLVYELPAFESLRQHSLPPPADTVELTADRAATQPASQPATRP